MTKIKDKPCSMCTYREISDRKNIYVDILKAINSIKISTLNIDNETIITKLGDLVCLKPISPVCVHFQDKYIPESLAKKLILAEEIENDSVIINKIAAEFPYSISEVKEIYYKCNKSISTTILKLVERTKNGR